MYFHSCQHFFLSCSCLPLSSPHFKKVRKLTQTQIRGTISQCFRKHFLGKWLCNRFLQPKIPVDDENFHFFFISAPCTLHSISYLWCCYHSAGTGRRGVPRHCPPPRSCRRRSSRRCRGTGTRTSPAPPPPAASHSLGEGEEMDLGAQGAWQRA
jgi:hypothetical protein